MLSDQTVVNMYATCEFGANLLPNMSVKKV